MLVDTNVVSELMRPDPDRRVSAWATTQNRFELSVVSLEEICYGLSARKSARLARWFDRFVLDHCQVLPVSARIARRSADLRATLRAKGQPRTQADMLIAATAAEHDLIVVTRNERDFGGCGIRVLNPFKHS